MYTLSRVRNTAFVAVFIVFNRIVALFCFIEYIYKKNVIKIELYQCVW